MSSPPAVPVEPGDQSRRVASAVLAAGALAAVCFVDDHRLEQSTLTAYVVEEAEESPTVQAVRRLVRRAGFPALGMLGALACVAVPRAGRWRWPGIAGLSLAAFLGLTLASLAWSDQPGETARRLAVAVSLWLLAFGLARGLTDRLLIGVLAAVPVLHLGAGVLAELANGSFTPWAGAYRFVGTTHPNNQALQLATACLGAATLATWRRENVSMPARIALFGLAAVTCGFVLLTKSRTAAAGLLMGLVAIVLARGGWRSWAAAAWGGVAAAGVGLAWLGLATGDAASAATEIVTLGRGEQLGTLTGRSVIWETVLPYIEDRPWLGYGADAFWNDEARVKKIWEEVGWPITSAHSQWLETALATGLVGSGLLALLIFATAIRAATAWLTRRRDFALFAFALTAGLTLNAFMESHLFVGTRYMAWAFVATVTRLALFEETERTRDSEDA